MTDKLFNVFDLFILGVYVSLTSVVLVDLLGLEVLTSSFGLTLLFTGVAAVVGPPVAGTMATVCMETVVQSLY